MPATRKQRVAIIATAVVALVVVVVVFAPWGGAARPGAGGVSPAAAQAPLGEGDAVEAPAGFVALDPQPEVVIGTTSLFCFDPEEGGEEAGRFLDLLGGRDPETNGLMVADPTMDSVAAQRGGRLPGFENGDVMGVINLGGRWAGVGSIRETEDTLTGAVVARRDRIVSVRATALEGGLIALDAELRDENDRNALEVVGRRAGIAIGRTETVADSLILEPGQKAVLRLAGSPMQIVLLEVRVRAATPAAAGGDPAVESGGAPSPGG